jgi:CheY-like chemotaxis protein
LIDDLILIIDDDFDIASLIRISLEKLGLSVTCFADPLEALKEFSSHYSDYNLVISDIRMPHMNGYGFVQEVKKNKT